MPLGYVPYLQPGALIFTIIAWKHLVDGQTNATACVASIHGHSGARQPNLMGERVKYVAEILFNNSLSAEEVLRRHTLFGIYSRALTQQAADLWAKSVIAGVGQNSVRKQARVAVRTGFRFFTAELRSCRECVERDIDTIGIPAWHALHMVPPLHHCPYHGCALFVEATRHVGGGGRWKLQLPTRRTTDRLGGWHLPASDGYASYLRRWVDLLNGTLPIMAADCWANYMDRVVLSLGGLDSAYAALIEHVSRSWGIPHQEIPSLLGAHVQAHFIRDELEHRSSPGRIAQKLIVLSAAEALGVSQGFDSAPQQFNLRLERNGDDARGGMSKQLLRSALVHLGFPLAILRGLASGHQVARIANDSGVKRLYIQKIIGRLPTDLLTQLLSIDVWPTDSWLLSEHHRRKKLDGSRVS